jgi:hypothetical protein
MMALPAIKTLNDEKKLLLKQGHRALDAPLLMHDDGIASFSMKAGAMNPNTVSADGKPLVIPMPASNVQVGLELMAVEDADIDSAFLVDLFKLLLDDPKVFSATQVVEMAAQKGILIAPTIGGQQSGYLGPMIDREIDLAAEMGLLLPMPPQLVEARGEYEVVYTSPLSRAAKAESVAGLSRTLDRTLAIVQATGNPAPLDNYDFDVIERATAEINGVPEEWMRSNEEITLLRRARQEAQQAQLQVQALPGAAAMQKAQNGQA